MSSHRKIPLVLVFVLALAPLAQAQTLPATPIPSKEAALPSLAPLVESVKSAVINVDVQSRGPTRTLGGEDQGDDFFEHFFGRRGGGGGQRPIRQGAGSGFIIDPRGIALTNNHVVEGAVNIRVRLDDGRSFDAQVLGRDPLTDVAVIKLKGNVKDLPVVKLGDSDGLRVGDWVMAIGNPFGLASSVSLGIISARARTIGASSYDDFLQTDAAINPGNSGGPLFNLKGEVIGINTAIVGGGSGIGFAVPSSLVKAILPQLEKDGSVTRGFLGVGIQDLTPELAQGLGVPVREGAVVVSVSDGSPAKKAGLKEDDVVTAIDGVKISSGGALTRTVALKRPESTSTMTVYRGSKQLEVKVTLGTRPDLEKLGVTGPADRGQGDEAEEARKAKIGLAFQSMDPRLAQRMGLPAQGAVITEVMPGSPAERADLREGMVVTEAGGKSVKSADDLMKSLRGAKSGSTILLRVQLPGANGGRGLRGLTLP